MSLKRLWPGVVLVLGARSQDQTPLDERIHELEQKVQSLEQRVQASRVTPANSPAATAAGTNGFGIKSDDGNFAINFGFDLQIDNRTFFGAGSGSLLDQIVARRVRPTLSGTLYKYIDFYVRPDFGLGAAVLYEAYIELKYFPRANLRLGKFKPPVGLERLQSDDDTNFIERGYPTLLVPSRDIGFQLSGDLVKRRVYYALGVFNGVPDNGLSDTASSSHRDYDGRIFLTPFLPQANHPLNGLGIGIGASSGSVDGIPLPSFKTFGQNNFFPLASGVTSAGHRTRLAPQAYYYAGPFGLFAEYGLTEEGFQKGALRKDIAFRAWQVQLAYLLTGENKSFGSPIPKKSFDPRNGGWGAVGLTARVNDFSAETGIYNYGFASVAAAPRHAHEWAGGVNWYLNRMLRISLDYAHTNFGGGAPLGGNRPSERALLQRFQIAF